MCYDFGEKVERGTHLVSKRVGNVIFIHKPLAYCRMNVAGVGGKGEEGLSNLKCVCSDPGRQTLCSATCWRCS